MGTLPQASIPKWMSVFFQKTYYNSSRGEVLYQGGPKFFATIPHKGAASHRGGPFCSHKLLIFYHLTKLLRFFKWFDNLSHLEITLQIIIFAIMELDKVKYWTEISDYDLETAEAMYSTGRW